MFDELENYLLTIFSDTRVDNTLVILNNLLELVGPDNLSELAHYPLDVPTEVDPMTEISRWDDRFTDIILSSFAELGITLDEDALDSAAFLQIEKMTDALTKVVAWEDSDRLMAMLTVDDDREGALASVIKEISGGDEGSYLLLIANVSAAFHENLLELTESNAESETLDIVPIPDYVLTRVRAWWGGRESASMVRHLVTEGNLELGRDLPFYLDTYQNDLYEIETGEAAHNLALYLMEFALCSNVPNESIDTVTLELVDNYTDSMESAVELRNRIRDRLQDYHTRVDTGVEDA